MLDQGSPPTLGVKWGASSAHRSGLQQALRGHLTPRLCRAQSLTTASPVLREAAPAQCCPPSIVRAMAPGCFSWALCL
jgi:hypothetical protein